MSESKIAARYARSLYDKASESGVLEKVVGDIKSLNEITKTNKDFVKFLNSPLISRQSKKSTLAGIFKNYNKETLNLFDLMTDKRRENLIGFVGAEFIHIYNRQHGITVARVTSAAPLDKDSLNQAEMFVKAKTGANAVEITSEVDQSLIGGMTIMFEGKIYDSSIASQIKKIKKELNIA